MKKVMPPLIFSAVLFISLLSALDGQTAEKVLYRDFLIDSWTSDKGLPENTVTGICQTEDGYLWLSTLGGLARFDGVKFVPFNILNPPAMVSNQISSMSVFGRNGLVMGTSTGDVLILRDGRIDAFGAGRTLGNIGIVRVFGDPDSAVWVVTNRSVFFLKNGKISEPDLANLDGSPKIVNAFPGAGGRVWLATEDKRLLCLEENRLRSYLMLPGDLTGSSVSLIAETPDGVIWIGTESRGLFRSEKGDITPFMKGSILDRLTIINVLEDSQGTLWIGTKDHGLFAVYQRRIIDFSGIEGLASEDIRNIFIDREGTVWVGSDVNGLLRIKYKSVRSFTTEDGLIYNFLLSVAQDREDGVWIGAFRGSVSRWKNGVFTNYYEKDGFPRGVSTIFSDSRGRLWMGSPSRGLFCYDGRRMRIFTVQDGLPNNRVHAVYEDASNRLWVGTENGLALFQNDSFVAYPDNARLQGNTVISILVDRKERVWIGTEGQGLCCYQDGRFVRYSSAAGLSSDIVRAIYEDRDGAIWIGTYGGGLNRFKDGKFVPITTNSGFFDDIVSLLLEDEAGNFWMSCNRGIYQANRRELNEFADGQRTSVSCRSFGQKEGMQSEECNGGAQPAGCLLRDGRLIVPTFKGIAVLNVNALKTNPVPPPVYVEGIVADGQEVAVGSKVVLAAGTKRVEIHYTALSFVAPEKIRFRVKLEGFDTDWTGPDNRRIVSYTNIHPKAYRFKVIACNNDGVWNQTGASFDLIMQPYFYERGWFYVVVVFGAVLSTYGAYRFRVRTLRKREDMLEHQVVERTRRLSEEIAEKKKAEEALRESEEKYRTIIENSQEIIMLIRPDGTIYYVSPSVEKILGYSPEEMLGPIDMRLVHPVDRTVVEKIIAEAMNGKGGGGIEYRAFKRNGEIRWMSHSWSPVVVDGRLRLVVNFVRDITEQRQTVDRIQTSLREKEVLIKEIHHRVKNNMQVISSMLNLQSQVLDDPKVLEIVKECQGRIRSMALVHEKLYQSQDLSHIDFSEYLKTLLKQLFAADRIDPQKIRLSTDLEKVYLNINTAVPCGLIVHELISNCRKHAFPGGRDGVVIVRFRQIGQNKFLIEIRDDGVGFPQNIDFRSTKSLGMQIVNILVGQIDGVVTLDRNGGTMFRIEFTGVKS